MQIVEKDGKPAVKTEDYIVEKNLIQAQSDTLRIFTYEEEAKSGAALDMLAESAAKQSCLKHRLEFSLNDKILEIVPVPLNEKQDYLFILTMNLHCVLLAFNNEIG